MSKGQIKFSNILPSSPPIRCTASRLKRLRRTPRAHQRVESLYIDGVRQNNEKVDA
jgi:uncharacterized protein (DUF2132 family)